ncbi:hypothetical protein CK503_09345 [Aliifodinibius salipaludis]|uniref:HTTM domain-containing protein n=1 Tax=Fodinibius salipaludis TaxID=2032627 RepID=A0A2A2GAI9_9BACT|nr:hypothetical protein CK503_09345 [Aliifodinibius salipaludis]
MAALFVLFGYRTKLAIIVTFVLLLSLHNKNPWILNSGDAYLRMVVFWNIFLPLNKFYSFDNLNNKKPKNTKYTSFASFGFILQILLLYVITGFLKSSPEWL